MFHIDVVSIRKGGVDNKLMSKREYYSIRAPIFFFHVQLKHRPRLYLYTRQGDKWGRARHLLIECFANHVTHNLCTQHPQPCRSRVGCQDPSRQEQLEHDIYCFRQWASTCCIFLFHIIKATTDYPSLCLT